MDNWKLLEEAYTLREEVIQSANSENLTLEDVIFLAESLDDCATVIQGVKNRLGLV